jgi:hypothetical protein
MFPAMPATITTLPNSLNSSWTTGFFGGDFRWTSDQYWGVHLKYDYGAEGGWSPSLFATGGTDNVWSADVFYAWRLPSATVRGFLGYGNVEWRQSSNFFGNQGFLDTKLSGWRVGADAAIPIAKTPVAVNASVAWYPSSTATASGAAASGSGTGIASDYEASVQYTAPAGWLAEAGYRWIDVRTWGYPPSLVPPSGINWTTNGPFFAVGYHW